MGADKGEAATARTVGDNLAGKVIQRRKLKDELRDLSRSYRERIKELDDEIESDAAESGQALLDV